MIHNKLKPEIEIFYTFEAVGKQSKPSLKLELLKKIYLKHPIIFKEIIEMVYSREKFNIGENILKQIKHGNEYTATFSEFKDLVYKAQKREISGNKLKAVLQDFFSKTDAFTAKWYKRILLKDLRIGVGYELITKVFDNQHRIRSFAKPMKATLSSDISEKKLEELFSEVKWEWELKFDGFRCFAVLRDNDVTLYSYNGTRVTYLEQVLLDDLLALKEKAPKLPCTIDGEVASKDWNSSMAFSPGRKNPLSKSEEEAVRFYAFDLLKVDPTEIPRKSHIVYPLKNRKEELHELLSKTKTKHFVYVKSNRLLKSQLNTNYLSDLAVKLVHKAKLFDGIVVKHLDSPYEFDKRSKWWIKFKEFETIDLMCVDVIKSDKRPGEIAAIVVLYKGKKVKVSGFKEEEAKYFYQHPEAIVGKIVEVKYLDVTKDGSLRHPSFIRVRNDKDTPDA